MNEPNRVPLKTGSALQAGRGEIRTPAPNIAGKQQNQAQDKPKDQPSEPPKSAIDPKETPAKV